MNMFPLPNRFLKLPRALRRYGLSLCLCAGLSGLLAAQDPCLPVLDLGGATSPLVAGTGPFNVLAKGIGGNSVTFTGTAAPFLTNVGASGAMLMPNNLPAGNFTLGFTVDPDGAANSQCVGGEASALLAFAVDTDNSALQTTTTVDASPACVGETVTLTTAPTAATGTTATFFYEIVAPNPTGAMLSAASVAGGGSVMLTNLNAPGTVTIEVTEANAASPNPGQGSSTPETVTITVLDAPTVTTANSGFVCVNDPASPVVLTASRPVTLAVTAISGTNLTGLPIVGDAIALDATNNLIVPGTLADPLLDGTVQLTLLPTSDDAAACSGTPFSVNFVVQAQPDISSTASAAVVCGDGTSAFDVSFEQDGTNFTEVMLDLVEVTNGNLVMGALSPQNNLILDVLNGTPTGIPTQMLVNTGTVPVDVTFRFRARRKTGAQCVSTFEIVTVTVNPLLTPTAAPISLCETTAGAGTAIINPNSLADFVDDGLDNGSLTGADRQVRFFNGDPTAGGTVITGNVTLNGTGADGVAAGNLFVELTYADGSCGSVITNPFTINALPTLTLTNVGPLETCPGETIQLMVAGTTAFPFTAAPTVTGGTATGATVVLNTNGDPEPDGTPGNPLLFDVSATGSGTIVLSLPVANNNGCVTTLTPTVTVLDAPVPTLTVGSATGCAGSPITLQAGSTGGTGNVSLSFSATGGFPGGVSVTPTATAGTFELNTPATLGAASIEVVLTATDDNCAVSTSQTVQLLANPTLTLSSATTALCVGGSSGVIAAMPSGGAGNFGAPTVAIISPTPATGITTTVSGNEIVVNAAPGAVTGAVVLAVTVADENGCSATTNLTATVNPLPTATATAVTANATACAGGMVQFEVFGTGTGPFTATANSTAASLTVTDESGDPAPDGTSTTPLTFDVTGTTAGTFPVTFSVTDANGCTGTTSADVTFLPLPTPTVTAAAAAVCVGDVLDLTTVFDGGSTAVSTFVQVTPGTPLPAGVTIIDAAGASPQLTVAATTTATAVDLTFTATDAAGCTASISQTVAINPLPVFTVAPIDTTVCAGATVTFIVSPADLTLSVADPTTVLGNAITFTAPATAGPASFLVTATDALGCSTTQAVDLTVLPLPAFTIDAQSGTGDVCAGVDAVFTLNATTGALPLGFALGNVNPANTTLVGNVLTVSNTAGLSGTQTVSAVLTDGNGCTQTVTRDFVVGALPEIVATPLLSTDVCAGDSIRFILSSTTGTPGFTFTAGTGATVVSDLLTVSTAGLAPGAQAVAVTVTDAMGCTATGNVAFTVLATPNIVVDAANGTAICIDEGDLTFSLSSNVGQAPFSFDLDTPPAGVTIDANGVVTVDADVAGAGTLTIDLEVTDANGCVATATQSITVNALPDFTIDPQTTATTCAGGTLLFDLTAGVGVPGPVFTTASANATVVGTLLTVTTDPTQITGTQDVLVSLADGNGCTNTQTVTVTVNELPSVGVAATANVCTGDQVSLPLVSATGTAPVTFTENSPNATVTFDLSGNPQLTFDAAGLAVGDETITVTATDAAGCVATGTTTITVQDVPAVTLTADAGNSVCTDGAITFTLSDDTGLTFTPSIPAVTVSGTTVTFDATGLAPAVQSFDIVATNAAGCSTTLTAAVRINALPDFTVTSPAVTTVCEGESLTFNFTLTAGVGPFAFSAVDPLQTGLTFGTNQVVVNTTGFAPGATDIAVLLTDGNGCTATQDVSLTVNERPAISGPLTTTVCQEESVTVTLTSATGTGPFTFSPDGTLPGNVTLSGDQLTFSAAGLGLITSTVDLQVSDANGCTGAGSVDFTVLGLPNVSVTPGVVRVCAGGTVDFEVSASSGNVGALLPAGFTLALDPATPSFVTLGADGETITFDASAQIAGTQTVTFTVTEDATGCSTTFDQEVLIDPTPTLSVSSATNGQVCTDSSIDLLLGSSTGTAPFTFGLGMGNAVNVTFDGAQTVTVDAAGLAAGTQAVFLTVADANGCTTTDTTIVTIDALPQVQLVGLDAICTSDAVRTIQAQLTDGTPLTTGIFDFGTAAAGIFTDNGDGTATFDPALAGAGSLTFGFSFTDPVTGCTGTTTGTILTEVCNEISITDPCGCLNNATTLENGQFTETITVTGTPGQVFTVVSATNFFTTASPAPPAAPVPVAPGTLLAEVAPGVYELDVIVVDDQDYSVTVTNEVDVLTTGNTCRYPNPAFVNAPDGACEDGLPFDIVATADTTGVGTLEILDGGGNVVLSATDSTLTVDPTTLALGSYTVRYTFDADEPAVLPCTNCQPGCIQAIEQDFAVVTGMGSMVCNGQVNVSLGDGCETVITPEIILSNQNLPAYDIFEVMIMDGPFALGNTVDASNLGDILMVKVINTCTGNSCWGTILVEDKVGPVFDCPADPIQVTCNTDLDAIAPPVAVDNCSGPVVPFLVGNVMEMFDCNDPSGLVMRVTRTFGATDALGNNAVFCTQVIEVLPGDLDDVVFPANLTVANGNAVSCDAPSADPALTGLPTLDGVNVDLLNGACNLSLQFSDDTVALCANGIKLTRTFSVFDQCLPFQAGVNPRTAVQLIEVTDFTAPVLTCPDTLVSVFTDGQSCGDNVLLPAIGLSDNCSAVADLTVQIQVPGIGVVNGNGGLIDNFPIDMPTTITYSVSDECGNTSTCDVEVILVDNVAPTPVCDEITDVNLGSDGLAVVFAATFDDGSSDNCALAQNPFLVRRMDSNDPFGPTVTFDCADAGDTVMVILQVTDFFGNTNTCMVEAIVNDKLPPVVQQCPQPAKIACDVFIALGIDGVVATFPDPVFADNCSADGTMTAVVTSDIDNACNSGTITRTTRFTDANGTATCVQTIEIGHVSNFVVEFPEDAVIECSVVSPAQADPALTGAPEIFFDDCELIGISRTDMNFDTQVILDPNELPTCGKIIRRWSVVNWCVVGEDIPTDLNNTGVVDQEVVEASELALRNAGLLPANGFGNDGSDVNERTFRDSWNLQFQPGDNLLCTDAAPDTDPDLDPWDGFVTYQQTIEIVDTEAPVITACAAVDTVGITGTDCLASVLLTPPTATDCSPVLATFATVDFGAGALTIVDFAQAIPNVGPGDYTVTFTVADGCNNSSTCTQVLTVIDRKAPTPVCTNLPPITLVANGDGTATATLDIGPIDFTPANGSGSFDNCTAPEDLTFSLSATDPTVQTRDFSCDDLAPSGQTVVQVDIFVTDEAGNQAFCTVDMNLNVAPSACGDALVMLPVMGSIATESGHALPAAEVLVSAAAPQNTLTDTQGDFDFDLEIDGDYSIVPRKLDEVREGVSTYDIVRLSRHILGVEPLTSPYQLIAADANNSESISTLDLVAIRRVILYLDNDFPANTSYRFVDAAYTFPDPANPWLEDFPEVYNLNNLATAMTDLDFVAVKIGDVSGNANDLQGNAATNRNAPLTLRATDRAFAAGETVTLTLTLPDTPLAGWQAGLAFDPATLAFEAGAATVRHHLTAPGSLLLSAADAAGYASGSTVSLTFRARRAGTLAGTVALTDRRLAPEAYPATGSVRPLRLAFGAAATTTATRWQAAAPNPFDDRTQLRFVVAEGQTATCTIVDVHGRLIFTDGITYRAGMHRINLAAAELPGPGLYFAQLRSTDGLQLLRLVRQ